MNNFFITANNDYIEDITHLFDGKGKEHPNEDLILDIEGKGLNELQREDIQKLVNALKVSTTKNNTLNNQVSQINKDLAQMRRLNMELTLMIDRIKDSCKKDKESCDRLHSIVRAFKLDTMNTLFSFTLDGEEINVTNNQMKQIVGWYPKGYVYFKVFDDINIRTDKVHLFTFGEIMSYVDRQDTTKNCECMVVGEDENSVHVMFINDFDRGDDEGVLQPTIVLKSRIEKHNEDNRKVKLAIKKNLLMTFLLNIGYTNPFHDETQY